MKEKFCPTGNHFRKLMYFRVATNGRVSRDCHDCEIARRNRHKTSTAGRLIKHDQDGVDIDAIHYKRGAIRG